MRGLSLVITMACVALMTGCASKMPPESSGADTAGFASSISGDYRIGVDDRIQVTVWRNPELSVNVPVRPDGKISVPLIGDVQAGGNTAEEVSRLIKTKLSMYIREPSVTVIVTELRSHEFLSRIRVTGAVRTPRSIPHRPGMTVLDAVLEAGGVNDFAAPSRTKVYRKTKDKTDIYDIDLNDILLKGNLTTNVDLLPGDIVTVPERIF
jgi:polysaccharide export outer membrane protein